MTSDPDFSERPFPPTFEAELVVYSAREQARTFSVPAGFADRLSERFAARVRFIRGVKWATTGLLTALLVGGYVAHREPQGPIVNPLPQPGVVESPPKIGDSLSDAGEALASLSRDTAEKTVAPTRSIFESVEKFRVPPAADVSADLTPATQTFAAMPTAAKSSLEPLTNNTRRAINLFLRDTGLQATN